MNNEELLQYISFKKEIFTKYNFWVIDSKNKCFRVKIRKTYTWLDTGYEALNIEFPNNKLSFPIRVIETELPPFEGIFNMWKEYGKLRLGQWFMNCFTKNEVDIVLFNETEIDKALQMIYVKYYLV